MAKVVGPLHSSEARGRVGALVYNTWRGISYVKAHSSTVHTPTASQLAQRVRIANANTAWRTLSNAQRLMWHGYANQHLQIDWTGNPIRLSGQQMYIRNSVRAVYVGGSNQSTPPVGVSPYAAGTITITPAVLTIAISFLHPAQPTADTYRVQVYRQGPISTGAQPSIHRWRCVTVTNYSTGFYLDTVPSVGRYAYWLCVVDQATGQHSPLIRKTVDVVIGSTGAISGILADVDNDPVPSVDVDIDGSTVTSNASGAWLISSLAAGPYTVTPDPTLWTWAPTSRTVTVVAGNTIICPKFIGTPV